jgi:hypothetical protein
MSRQYGEYTRRGARIAAIVIDSPAQNAAIVQALQMPFPILSDPGGAEAILPYGVWDEAGNMARPAILVLDPQGNELYRYVGEDFMDRPTDEVVIQAVDSLDLPAVDPPDDVLATVPPEPGSRAMRLENLGTYMRGVRACSNALGGRARDDYDRQQAQRTSKMAEAFISAQGQTMRLNGKRGNA